MKKLFYTCLWVIATVSCRKDDVLPVPVEEEIETAANFNFVKQISAVDINTSAGHEFERYAYDDHGRIAFYQNSLYVETFLYPSNSQLHVIRRDETTQIKFGEWKASLHNNRAIKTLEYFNPDGNLISTDKFKYDDSGYMIQRQHVNHLNPSASFEEQFNIEKDIIRKTTFLINNKPLKETIYSYTQSRKAYMLQTPYAQWKSLNLFGKPLLRVASGHTIIQLADNKTMEQTSFEYKTDDEGYVIRQKNINRSNIATAEIIISY